VHGVVQPDGALHPNSGVRVDPAEQDAGEFVYDQLVAASDWRHVDDLPPDKFDAHFLADDTYFRHTVVFIRRDLMLPQQGQRDEVDVSGIHRHLLGSRTECACAKLRRQAARSGQVRYLVPVKT